MKIVITGSRSLVKKDVVIAAFERAFERVVGLTDEWDEYHHGGAEGVDQIVADHIEAHFNYSKVMPPHLPNYPAHGKYAPHVRNDEMLALPPDVVIAIWDGDSPGTRSMIRKCAHKGIPILVEVISR